MMQNVQRLSQPFGDLEIGVMARREPHAFAGNEIDERVARRRRRGAHRLHHAFERLRAGDRRDIRESVADVIGFGAHAAGHDHVTVLVHRLADGGEGFLFRAVEKTAGVDDHRIGAGMIARKLVAFGAQPRENPLAVDQRLRAAERDEGNARRGAGRGLGDVGHARQLPRAGGGGKAHLRAMLREKQPRWLTSGDGRR